MAGWGGPGLAVAGGGFIGDGDGRHAWVRSRRVLSKVLHDLATRMQRSSMVLLLLKVMTAQPECATIDTTILEALHIMHDGRFLHLPVLDNEGIIVACMDVLHITHAALSMVEENPDTVNNMASTMIQKFWDSAFGLEKSDEDCDACSESHSTSASDTTGIGNLAYPSLGIASSFIFKIKDQHGRMHKLNCGTKSLGELHAAIKERLKLEDPQNSTRLLYIDEEGDKVSLDCDNDLTWAVNNARAAGWKVLRLYLDFPRRKNNVVKLPTNSEVAQTSGWRPLKTGILAGTIILTGITVAIYLKRSRS